MKDRKLFPEIILILLIGVRTYDYICNKKVIDIGIINFLAYNPQTLTIQLMLLEYVLLIDKRI